MSHVPRNDWTMPTNSIMLPAEDPVLYCKAIHENVEEYQSEDLNPLVSYLIRHSAPLRYVFMILPLFLVLVPEVSSCNMTELRNDYENILVNIIIHLLFDFKYLYVIFGNFGAEGLSQNIISSCNPITTKCYLSPENTTIITSLALCLKIKANCTKIPSELKNTMGSVSDLTLYILNKNYCTLQSHNHSRYYHQCKKFIRKFDCTHTLCCLKNVVSALSSWWKKFLYHDYPQRE